MSQSTANINSFDQTSHPFKIEVDDQPLNNIEQILKEMTRDVLVGVSVADANNLKQEAQAMGLLEPKRFDNFFSAFTKASNTEFQLQYDEMKENVDIKKLKKKKLFSKKLKKMAQPWGAERDERSKEISTRLITLFRRMIGRSFNTLKALLRQQGEEIVHLRNRQTVLENVCTKQREEFQQLETKTRNKDELLFNLQRKLDALEENLNKKTIRDKQIEEDVKTQKEITLNFLRNSYAQGLEKKPQTPPRTEQNGNDIEIGFFSDTFFMN